MKATIKNKIFIIDNYGYMKIINRTGNIFFTIIDKEDVEKLLKFNRQWHIKSQRKQNEYYVYCTIYNGTINKKPSYTTYALHQFLMNINPKNKDYKIDHINHDRLDNRKINLRLLDNDKNTKYRYDKNSNNTSEYRNVTKINDYWRIQIQINGKNHLFKEKFVNIISAANFAKEMRNKYYGEFAGN